MKKLALLGVLLLCLTLVSCPLDFSHLMTLCVELDKKEIFLGEKNLMIVRAVGLAVFFYKQRFV